MPTSMDYQEWAALLTIVVTIAGGLLAFHLRIVKPVTRRFKALAAIVPKVELLVAELSPNGGTSIKDKINRIDLAVRVIDFRNRSMQELLDEGIYEADPSGMCTYANRMASHLFGLTPEEMQGTGWLRALDDDDRLHQWNAWLRATEAGIPYSAEYNIINQITGSVLRVRTRAAAIKDHAGRTIGYYGSIHPVEVEDVPPVSEAG